MSDPLHKSKRIGALAAVLAPYVVRWIVAKTGVSLPEDVYLILHSSVTEGISLGIATVLIGWSKLTERVKNAGVCGAESVSTDTKR